MKRTAILILAAILLFSFVPTGFSFAEAEEGDHPVWEIWGEMMASEPEAKEYTFEKAFDPSDFRPTLTAFLLGDQTDAKGNMIVCSGGGDRSRSDDK